MTPAKKSAIVSRARELTADSSAANSNDASNSPIALPDPERFAMLLA